MHFFRKKLLAHLSIKFYSSLFIKIYFYHSIFPLFFSDKRWLMDVVATLVRGLKFSAICILQFPRESTIADMNAVSSYRGDIYILVSLFSSKLLRLQAANGGPRRNACSDTIASYKNFC